MEPEGRLGGGGGGVEEKGRSGVGWSRGLFIGCLTCNMLVYLRDASA